MKKLLLITFATFSLTTNAQSKKELQADVDRLNTELNSVKNDLEITRTNLDKARSKYEGCLEDKEEMMDRQTNLMNQNLSLKVRQDSLEAAFSAAATGVISEPKNKVDSMIMVVQQYLFGASVDQRLKHVIQNTETRSRMEKYYASNGVRSIEKKANEIALIKTVGNYSFVRAGEDSYYLKKTDKGYLIDWETSVGYNETNLNAFKANTSIKTVTVRGNLKLTNLYFANYRGKENQYWSVKVRDGSGTVWCYVGKSSTIGKKIHTLLSDGMEHKAIVEIQTDRSADTSGSEGIILNLVSDSWILE